MLDLFRRPGDPPEYGWLYAIPGVLFAAGLLWAWQNDEAGLTEAGYTVATFLCIGALTGLSAQVSRWPRRGIPWCCSWRLALEIGSCGVLLGVAWVALRATFID